MEKKLNLSELSYGELVELIQDGKISLADFCRFAEGSTRDEYDEWCHDEGLDPDNEDSAEQFMEHKQQQYEASPMD